MEKIFGRDHVIALFQKLQLSPERICLDQVAIQSQVPDYVAGGEHAVVSHNRWTSASRVAEVHAPGQGGKDEVLQSRTDESQGYLLQLGRIVSHGRLCDILSSVAPQWLSGASSQSLKGSDPRRPFGVAEM